MNKKLYVGCGSGITFDTAVEIAETMFGCKVKQDHKDMYCVENNQVTHTISNGTHYVTISAVCWSSV